MAYGQCVIKISCSLVKNGEDDVSLGLFGKNKITIAKKCYAVYMKCILLSILTNADVSK